jgi:hypothetical protein
MHVEINRALTMAALPLIAAAALTLAAPANAELAAGRYTMNFRAGVDGSSGSGEWTVNPCGPGCLDVASTNGWTARAVLANGQYSFERTVPGGATCDDGRVIDLYGRYTFNEDGSNGSLGPANGISPCGGPFRNSSFTLTPA